MDESDVELVRRARSGDDGAFRRLVEKYISLAGSITYGILGDFHLAEDAVQETFVRIHRYIRRLEHPEQFRRFLIQTAKTVALGHLRRARTEKRGHPTLLSSFKEEEERRIEFEAADVHSPDTLLSKEELRRRIICEIEALPEGYREVVVMRHMEGLSCKEMAELLGESSTAVEARLFRAREILRKRLKRYFQGE